MKNIKVHFSSQSDNWRTPANFYRELDKEFHFDFDPCPINPTFDGLACEWGKMNFCNPPYSQINKWLEKAYIERERERIKQLCLYQVVQIQNGGTIIV